MPTSVFTINYKKIKINKSTNCIYCKLKNIYIFQKMCFPETPDKEGNKSALKLSSELHLIHRKCEYSQLLIPNMSKNEGLSL